MRCDSNWRRWPSSALPIRARRFAGSSKASFPSAAKQNAEEKVELTADAATGRLIRCSITSPSDFGRLVLRSEEGAFARVLREVATASATFTNRLDPQDPWSSSLAFLGREFQGVLKQEFPELFEQLGRQFAGGLDLGRSTRGPGNAGGVAVGRIVRAFGSQRDRRAPGGRFRGIPLRPRLASPGRAGGQRLGETARRNDAAGQRRPLAARFLAVGSVA